MKLLGLQIGGRLVIANHLDQSNYLANSQTGGAVNKYDLTAFIAHSSRALKPTANMGFEKSYCSSLFCSSLSPWGLVAFYLIKFGRDSSSSEEEEEANRGIGQLGEEFHDMISIEILSHASMDGF